MARQNFCIDCGKPVGLRALRCGSCRNLTNPLRREYARRGAMARAERQTRHREIAERVIGLRGELLQLLAALPEPSDLERLAALLEDASAGTGSRRTVTQLRHIGDRIRSVVRSLELVATVDEQTSRVA